ncbi:MAG: ankyrin repeat domain-containing protein, partial [Candidatus Amoebophilus sp.]
LSISKDLLQGRDDLNFMVKISNQDGKEAHLNKFKLKISVAEPHNTLNYIDAKGTTQIKSVIDENLTHFTGQQLLQSADKPINLEFTIQPQLTSKQVNIKASLYYEGTEQAIIEKSITWQETVSPYQLSLNSISASDLLEGGEEYIFKIENQDPEHAVATDEVILSLQSKAEFTLNGCVATEQGTLLKTVLGIENIEQAQNGKYNLANIRLKIKDPNGQTDATSVVLTLKDKFGNKLGSDKIIAWKPKSEISFILSFDKLELQGPELNNRQIKFTVNQSGEPILNNDELILQLMPEQGSMASILGANLITDAHGRTVYIYKIKKEDIGKEIAALSIAPQGSKEASSKAQLLYNGAPLGVVQKLNWQAGAELNFSLEGLEEKDKYILAGTQTLKGTDILQIVIKNLGRALEKEGEAVLCVEQNEQPSDVAFEVYYNYVDKIEHTTPNIALGKHKTVTIDFYHLIANNNFVKREDDIKFALQLLNPTSKQHATVTFQIKNLNNNSDITAPVTINWQAAINPVTREITDEMLAVVKKTLLCTSLYKVLKSIKKGKEIHPNDINKIDIKHPYGYTALQEAIYIGRLDIVTLLLDKGADVNMRNKCGQAPIELALGRFDIDMVRLLLKQQNIQSRISIYNGGGKLLLNLAIERANMVNKEKFTELTDLLLDHLNTSDVLNKQDSITKQTPLLLAMHYNQPELAKKLLEKGVNPNIKDNQGRNALHLAVTHNQKELAEQLIAKNIELDIKDDKGDTLLHMAVSLSSSKEVAKLLINKFKESGISLDILGHKEVTPLHRAAASQGDNVEIVTALLEAGAQLDLIDKDQQTPLHYAAQNNNIKVIEKLIQYSPGLINLQDKNGKTPLHMAASQNYNTSNIKRQITQTINFLIDKGARLDIQDNQGYTPLNILVTRNYADIVQKVLQNPMNSFTETAKINNDKTITN